MSVVNQIILCMNVPSIEETATWYARVLGWTGHFDTFDQELDNLKKFGENYLALQSIERSKSVGGGSED